MGWCTRVDDKGWHTRAWAGQALLHANMVRSLLHAPSLAMRPVPHVAPLRVWFALGFLGRTQSPNAHKPPSTENLRPSSLAIPNTRSTTKTAQHTLSRPETYFLFRG